MDTLGSTSDAQSIGQWASAIVESRMDGVPATGAERVCRLKGFGGFGAMEIREELIEFDTQRARVAYRVTSGLPAFVHSATNRWSVEDAGYGHSVITSRADIKVAWSCSQQRRFCVSGWVATYARCSTR
ncbi:MAG: SRPBCC family protein [Myxococcota bacterium]